MIPDSRDLPVRLPGAPRTQDEVLEWARRLMSALDKDAPVADKVFTPTYATSILYSPSTSNILKINTTTLGNCTISAKAGRIGAAWIIIQNDNTSARTIAFGTGFRVSGNLVGTIAKVAVVSFISDGVLLYETARITGL